MPGAGAWNFSGSTSAEVHPLGPAVQGTSDEPVSLARPTWEAQDGRAGNPWVIRYWGRVPYEVALREMDVLVAAKIEGDRHNYLLLLEHDPVYTLGRGGDSADVQGADVRFGIPVYRVGRGGGVTYHGPGQLVAYPVITLVRRDVRWYVRTLEEVLVRVCHRFGVEAGRGTEAVGVWVQGRKIASIGLGIRRWVAFHGVALNIDVDLRYFEAIVPCRLPGLAVTSLARELGWCPSWESVAHAFWQELWQALECAA